MSKKILITGAAGQLGQTLTRELRDEYDIIPTDIQAAGVSESGPAVLAMDITKIDHWAAAVSTHKPDIIINAAAYTNVDGCETEPETADAVNRGAVENLVRTAAPETKIVQISTDYIFDGSAGPYSEEDTPTAVSQYGVTKLAGEKLLMENHSNHLIFRPNVLFGPSNTAPASFFAWIYKSFSSHKPIRVVTDQVSNPTYSHFFSSAILSGIRQDARGVFHYGSANFISRFDFALEIARIFELSADQMTPILTADLKQTAPRPLNSGLITRKIESELGIQTYSTEESLMDIRQQMGLS